MARKGMYILVGTFMVYGILVASHKGEFWPFSIYPMFSAAGHPWVRALTRDVTNDSARVDWSVQIKNNLPGTPFPMTKVGINQNDLANFIHKNKNWSTQRIHGLRKYFMRKFDGKSFLVFKVKGRISEENPDSVAVHYIPYILIKKDTTIFNPRIFNSDTLNVGS